MVAFETVFLSLPQHAASKLATFLPIMPAMAREVFAGVCRKPVIGLDILLNVDS